MHEPAEIEIRVTRISPSLESLMYAAIELQLSNRGTVAQRVLRYRLRWPGGTVEFSPERLVLRPGERIVRSVRVQPTTAGFDTLLDMDAQSVDATIEKVDGAH